MSQTNTRQMIHYLKLLCRTNDHYFIIAVQGNLAQLGDHTASRV